MSFFRGVEQSGTAGAENRRPPKKVPDKGVGLFFFLLRYHFGKVMLLNFLFLLFSLPVVTMPAALSAMSRVYMLLMRDGYVQAWHDFVKEFKSSFFVSLLVGLVYALIMALLYIAARIYPQLQLADWTSTLFFSLAVALMLIVSVIWSYAFPMISLIRLRARAVIKNAALMLICAIKNSLVILLIVIAFNFTAFYLFPQSLPVTMTILISVGQLGICVAAKTPIEKFLIEPIQAKNKPAQTQEREEPVFHDE